MPHRRHYAVGTRAPVGPHSAHAPARIRSLYERNTCTCASYAVAVTGTRAVCTRRVYRYCRPRAVVRPHNTARDAPDRPTPSTTAGAGVVATEFPEGGAKKQCLTVATRRSRGEKRLQYRSTPPLAYPPCRPLPSGSATQANAKEGHAAFSTLDDGRITVMLAQGLAHARARRGANRRPPLLAAVRQGHGYFAPCHQQ